MIKMLIDCDPGVDDSLAIMFALNRPDVEVVGITTGVGNVTAAQGAENALRLVKLCGKEGQVPVCAGLEQPLVEEVEDFPAFIHGDNGTGNVELPETDQKPVEMDVRDFLYQKACENEGDLVLVTLGRLMNIATTVEKYPDFPRKIRKVVAMGGTIYKQGNVTPVCEANIAGDPEAADIVVQQDWDMTMVGLDVTLATELTKEIVDKAARYARPECKAQMAFLQEELVHYMKGARDQNWYLDASPTHDPLAMVVAVDPSVVWVREMVTRIETGGTYSRGRVIVDLREQPIEGRFVKHALKVDAHKALSELFAAFR